MAAVTNYVDNWIKDYHRKHRNVKNRGMSDSESFKITDCILKVKSVKIQSIAAYSSREHLSRCLMESKVWNNNVIEQQSKNCARDGLCITFMLPSQKFDKRASVYSPIDKGKELSHRDYRPVDRLADVPD